VKVVECNIDNNSSSTTKSHYYPRVNIESPDDNNADVVRDHTKVIEDIT